ncbi:transketolase [Mariniblastus fucicola]|uniref:Transketolase n=1 Tax=Mariniblastus fucicola TaxID=980251 RepID=A0A5B9PCW1_9BACT|nr:transketolase [Mariniblastus fucicola]QEG22386.1 Transketolase [Mariniblastus fucicola]
MTTSTIEIDQLAINTIRTLSMDAVQEANSGHPGTPMALAPLTYSLWAKFLNYDPANPNWMGRDRFVLSCGHASMLLYSVLHLAEVSKVDADGNPIDGPAISLEDIRNFRQLVSPCAGHPEFGYAAGIETTTGPLGQGLGNSVGMAIAGKWLAATYDKPGYELFGFDTYAVCSDGDVMEGIGCEAASLAGHLKLSNLCWVYDDNEITIEGRTDLAFSEDVAGRFESLGWSVITVEDANDLGALEAAYAKFKSTTDKPTLIIVKSIIGFGAPNKQDTSSAHGSPLGDEEIKLTKENYGWDYDKFTVPDGVLEHFRSTVGKRGSDSYAEWTEKFSAYKSEFPELATQLEQMQANELPEGWESSLPEFPADAKGMASRASSGKVLNSVCGSIPWMIGGSADLAGSNKSNNDAPGAGDFLASDYSGKNFHFGIREHAMAAASNGMSLCGLRPYCATFFVFTDYLRPSLRLSSIMHQPVLYIMTHDSIGLGEDGPTHQPVEHLAACRSIPGVLVMRPADANEVSACYRAALSDKKRPSVLVLSRQNLPTLEAASTTDAIKGAYVLQDCDGTPDAILMATGSEVQICVEAAEKLTAAGKKVRVVSVPCWELFDEQSAEYRESVLPAAVTNRVACEAGIKMGWEKYLGAEGSFVGMDSFGASGPFEELYEKFGITPDAVAKAAS